MSHYHLYAIGNALVDTEYEVGDDLLATMGVSKRHMTLIDAPRRTELLGHVQGLHHRRTGGHRIGSDHGFSLHLTRGLYSPLA